MCQHALAAWENIPLLSWLLLRGRCHQCGSAIPLRLFLVELISALFFGITALVHAGRSGAVLFVVTGGFLLPLAMIDWQHQLLPDCLTQPLLWAGLVLHAFDHTLPLRDALFGAVAGYLSLWLLYWAFRLITGREGLGYGDFKLLAALGAWCGWQVLPSIELAAALSGIVGYFAVNNLNKNNLTISFGPYLAFAGIVVFMSQQFAFTF